MTIHQKKAGIAISYVTEAVRILTSLLYTPIMLRLLGKSEYGLYQLVQSVVAYLGLLSLGFSSAYMRFYTRTKAKDGEEGIAKLNGIFMIIFSIISAICLICGFVMVINVQSIFRTGLTAAEVDKARILMAIMVLSLSLTFPNSVFNCYVTAKERFVFQKGLALIQAILNPFICLPLLIMGYGSVGMVCVSFILTVAVLISNIVYCCGGLKMHFRFNAFSVAVFAEMFSFTFFIFLNQIIDQINLSVDKFLIGRMISTTAVAVYGVGALLNSMYMQFSKSVSNVFVPQINRIVIDEKDDTKITHLFTKVGRIQFLILALILSGIVFFGKPFIAMWAGEGYEKAYHVALLLMVPVTVPLIQNLGIEIQRAKNMHRTRSVVYFFMALVNVAMSIPLIRHYGIEGAALGTTISLIISNGLFMNWYYNYMLGIDIAYFWKNIISQFKGLLIPIVVGIVIMRYANTDGIVHFLVWVAIYTLIYAASIWLFSMNDYEKDQVKSVIRRVWKR